jgi:hypothetical protein
VYKEIPTTESTTKSPIKDSLIERNSIFFLSYFDYKFLSALNK